MGLMGFLKSKTKPKSINPTQLILENPHASKVSQGIFKGLSKETSFQLSLFKASLF
jgi:hypothetical protein